MRQSTPPPSDSADDESTDTSAKPKPDDLDTDPRPPRLSTLQLSTDIPLFLLLLLPLCLTVYFTFRSSFIPHLLLSAFAFVVTLVFVPVVAKTMLQTRTQLWGIDIGKGLAGTGIRIPESLGIVPGIVYICAVCVVMLGVSVTASSEGDFDSYGRLRRVNLLDYCAALFCSMFMLFLGFADNVMNLRWRYKLILPALACLPLLVCYDGSTQILVPIFLRGKFGLGDFVQLGWFYKIYMGLVAIYCSNTINIYAGVNGLEVLQSVVIGISICIHNMLEMRKEKYQTHHMFSLGCMLPFVATSLALLIHNWFPSRVFVGDSYTYFAGMTFATVGILGHFSKRLMVLFIPQWINFFYSLPQLFHIVPIPRHRIPKYHEEDGLLHDSGNMTVLNLVLRIFGPMKEKSLTIVLGLLQAICCGVGLWLTYALETSYYPPEEFSV